MYRYLSVLRSYLRFNDNACTCWISFVLVLMSVVLVNAKRLILPSICARCANTYEMAISSDFMSFYLAISDVLNAIMSAPPSNGRSAGQMSTDEHQDRGSVSV